MKKILIALLLLSLANCSPFGSNPAQVAGGAVAGAAATKVIDKVKEISEFDPYLIVETMEICFKKDEYSFRCILTQCEEGNKINCEKEISNNEATIAIMKQEAVLIDIHGWSRFISAVEVKIKEDPEGVRQKYEDYRHIDKVLIIGG